MFVAYNIECTAHYMAPRRFQHIVKKFPEAGSNLAVLSNVP